MKTVNLYTGNIEGLILALQSMPIDAHTLQHYIDFAGETTQKAAHEKFYIGCPKLMAQYKKTVLDMKPFATCGNSYQYANEGLFFDVPTYLSGQPEHWINEVEEIRFLETPFDWTGLDEVPIEQEIEIETNKIQITILYNEIE